jgi:riboflavin biosynthesis pyrimidine reductase
MESDARFFRRRANEELAAAGRAVTEAARDRRLQLAGIFLERLKESEARSVLVECGIAAASSSSFDTSVFEWAEERIAQHA